MKLPVSITFAAAAMALAGCATHPKASKTIEQVMEEGFEGKTSLCAKVSKGEGQATDLEATLDLAFDDHAANPFLHTYHPDHDGRDVTFKTQLPAGMESYNIRRTIHLRILPQSANVFELGSRQAIRGIYFETVILKGLARAGGTHDTRTFQVAGTFNLRRVSDIPLLRKP